MKKLYFVGISFCLITVLSPAFVFAKGNDNKNAEGQARSQFARSLQRGISGSDVSALQQFLSQDKAVYPEGLVTGQFGPLTEQAVKRLQKKHGIEQLGIVGPKTIILLQRLLWNTATGSVTATTTSGQSSGARVRHDGNESVNEHGGSQGENSNENEHRNSQGENDNEDEHEGRVATSTSLFDGHKVLLCHRTGNGGGVTISVDIHAILSHIWIGDTIGACGGTASTTPPVISAVLVTPSVTTANVSWATNTSSDSTVWYATSTPVMSSASKLSVMNGALVTSHSVPLTGLSPSTTYFYLVVSKDTSGNTATSSEGSFTTTVSDTTAPLIFNVSAVPFIATANISWMTNELSTSRVIYATASDVLNTSPNFTVSDATLVTSHSLNLSGLAQGTQYYFLIVSADGSGNVATSTSNLYVFTTGILGISSLSATPLATSTTVNWSTNGSSDSTVWYATSTPVMSSASKLSVMNGALVTSHSVPLTGLSTSTTYYYLGVSKDAFGNIATSSENSFTTPSM